jgi:hypothetical protein
MLTDDQAISTTINGELIDFFKKLETLKPRAIYGRSSLSARVAWIDTILRQDGKWEDVRDRVLEQYRSGRSPGARCQAGGRWRCGFPVRQPGLAVGRA